MITISFLTEMKEGAKLLPDRNIKAILFPTDLTKILYLGLRVENNFLCGFPKVRKKRNFHESHQTRDHWLHSIFS